MSALMHFTESKAVQLGKLKGLDLHFLLLRKKNWNIL